MAEIIAPDSGAVIAEPNRTVGFDDDVVWASQFLAFEALGQYPYRSLMLGAREPLGVHFASNEPPLAIAGVAIGIVRRSAEYANRAGFFVPHHHAVVRDVAPNQATQVSEPHRSLIEAASARDHFYRCISEHERRKPRV